MMRSPLMIGSNLPGLDEFILSLLTNKEVLEVNEKSTKGKELFANGDTIVWVAENPESNVKYIAFFNHNDSIVKNISVRLSDIGLNDKETCTVYDIWNKNNLANAKEVISAIVKPHGTVFLKLSIK